jgi:hypothetical protein
MVWKDIREVVEVQHSPILLKSRHHAPQLASVASAQVPAVLRHAYTSTQIPFLRQVRCADAHPGQRARAKLSALKTGSAWLRWSQGNIEAVTSGMVGQIFADGDPVAGKVWRGTVEWVALRLGNIVEPLTSSLEEIRNRMHRFCLNSRAEQIPLLDAHFAVDAGIAGGAVLR